MSSQKQTNYETIIRTWSPTGKARGTSMFFGGIRRSIPSYAQGFGGLSSSHSSTAIGRGLLRRRINTPSNHEGSSRHSTTLPAPRLTPEIILSSNVKSILRLSGLKAGACSGLTLSGAFRPRLQRRGLAPSNGSTALYVD